MAMAESLVWNWDLEWLEAAADAEVEVEVEADGGFGAGRDGTRFGLKFFAGDGGMERGPPGAGTGGGDRGFSKLPSLLTVGNLGLIGGLEVDGVDSDIPIIF